MISNINNNNLKTPWVKHHYNKPRSLLLSLLPIILPTKMLHSEAKETKTYNSMLSNNPVIVRPFVSSCNSSSSFTSLKLFPFMTYFIIVVRTFCAFCMCSQQVAPCKTVA